jgi:hypothetical protein
MTALEGKSNTLRFDALRVGRPVAAVHSWRPKGPIAAVFRALLERRR